LAHRCYRSSRRNRLPPHDFGEFAVGTRPVKRAAAGKEQRSEFDRLDGRLQEIRQQWQVAWGQKAAREFTARLRLWRDFLEEYRKQPKANLDRYAYEVNRRVTLQLLSSDAEGTPDEELELLNGLDELLRAVFIPGQFVWDDELKASFPENPYWYLYGMPKEEL
jgi:hypothetical protein